MSAPESAARGRALLVERVAQAPDFVAAVPRRIERLLERPARLPRMLVATGIGTSEGHARHLAEIAARFVGQPARFAATASLARGAPRGAEQDWLVVFSQGLSANARHALVDLDRWGGVVLVTGLPGPGEPGFDALERDKQAWLERLAERGGVQIEMGCGAEYGTLLRVIGARVGYAVGWSLLRTLADRRLESSSALEVDVEGLRSAQRAAAERVERSFPPGEPVAPFFEASHPLVLMAEGGGLELVHQLSLKIAEGCLRPRPLAVDVLEFAHGPWQGLAERPASILYLAESSDRKGSEEWLERLRRTLEPERHDLRVLRADQPAPFGVLEYEAMLDALILRMLEETGIDLVDWPGADREAALYDWTPDVPPPRTRAADTIAGPSPILEDAVWPEIELALSGGRRTALIALGSVEQHGPHLPLATDRWIADALAERLAARLPEAIALPAVAFGCAREHLDFPGSLHIEPATLEALLGDLLASLAGHGFERAFVFSAHGGNVAALDMMRDRLTRRARPLELWIETDLAAVAAMQARVVEAVGLAPETAGPHAGEFETSIVAALRPGAVRREARTAGPLVAPEPAQSLFEPRLRVHAADGVAGDPRAALADRGESYLSAWVDLLERAYCLAFARPAPKKRT